jgi:hypothetical protein
MGPNNILLLLSHHWACDMSTLLSEDQRLALIAIMLLAVYSGCWPGELVDASKGGTTRKDLLECSDDTKCDAQDPWDNLDDNGGIDEPLQRCKALCYEDIRL